MTPNETKQIRECAMDFSRTGIASYSEAKFMIEDLLTPRFNAIQAGKAMRKFLPFHIRLKYDLIDFFKFAWSEIKKAWRGNHIIYHYGVDTAVKGSKDRSAEAKCHYENGKLIIDSVREL